MGPVQLLRTTEVEVYNPSRYQISNSYIGPYLVVNKHFIEAMNMYTHIIVLMMIT